ncbi:MAG: PAS domain-containing protein [Nitrospirae bacterium]|nr:PAS domain-containing protein [Nitrospirota bacterium]
MASKSGQQEILPESHEYYRHLIERSPIATCIQHNDEVVYVNASGVKIMGAETSEQIIGRSIADFINFKNNETIREQFRQAQENGVTMPPFEGEIIRVDGRVTDVELIITPILYQGERALQVTFYVITNRTRMYDLQAALNAILYISLEDIPLKDILERVIDQIVSIRWLALQSKGAILLTEDDSDVLILKAQRGLPDSLLGACAKLLFGRCMCGRAALSGKIEFSDCVDSRHDNTYDGIIPHGHYCVPIVSSGKVLGVINTYIKAGHVRNPMEEEFLTAIANVMAGIIQRKRAEEEIKKAKRDLEIKVKERTYELVNSNRQMMEEVTERKRVEIGLQKSENEFRRLSQEFNVLLDAITDNLILLSPDLSIMWANKAAASAFGMNRAELVGTQCYKMCCDTYSPCSECVVLRSFHTGREEGGQFTTPNGKILDIKAFPIKDETGRIKNVIEVARDITELMKLQAETMRTRHLASLGELAAGVAHEINNPINSIINYAQILADEFVKDGVDDDIAKRIIKDGDRIATMVRSLLSFARVRKEKKGVISLQEIFSETLALTSAQIRREGIDFRVYIPGDLPDIAAHSQELQQVFLNIINNSRFALNEKYPKPHKDKVLEISCEIMKTESPYVRIMFQDNGIGIPNNVIDKVMDPFFTTKPKGAGSGLGLSICHRIITDHNGRLMINSKEGEFTEVVIELPVVNGN